MLTEPWTYESARRAFFAGTLPADFSHWDLATLDGWTVAHVAAKYARLHTVYHFSQWDLSSAGGRTVAHEAATYGQLPNDFSQWELADRDGWTVAHEAAKHDHLPANFSKWDLAKDGWTVAHEAAVTGNLPADFDRWDLTDRTGRTVAYMANTYGRYYGRLPTMCDRGMR